MHEIGPITWPKIIGKYSPLDPIYLVIQFSERINQNTNWCKATVRISRHPHSAGVCETNYAWFPRAASLCGLAFIFLSVGSEKSGLIWGMHINEIAPEKYQRGE